MDALLSAVAERLMASSLTLSTAESCTGGWLGQALTSVSGSSQWYEGGVISYSNRVKHTVLQVPESSLATHGAVSEAVALAMASGVQSVMSTSVSVATTGVAGPTGGSPDKPVGTVWIAWRMHQTSTAKCFLFDGNREQIRRQTVEAALAGLLQRMN